MNGGFSHQHISWGDAWAGTGLLNLECDMLYGMVLWIFGQTSAIFHTFIQKGISRLGQWQICMWQSFSSHTNLRSATIEKNRMYIQWQSIVPLCFSQGNMLYVDLSKNIMYLKTRTVSVIKTAQKSLLKTTSLMLDFVRKNCLHEVEFFFILKRIEQSRCT